MRLLMILVVIATVALWFSGMSAASAHHRDFHENPPQGTAPSEFATENQNCLGPLRSQIAQGDFSGVGPFGDHFTGDVNPGAHQGTVAEEEFLTALGLDPGDCPFQD